MGPSTPVAAHRHRRAGRHGHHPHSPQRQNLEGGLSRRQGGKRDPARVQALWTSLSRKRWTGYHVRSRIEAQMRRLKAFGARIASRDPDRQTAEIHIRIALMNRFSALGQAEITRVA